MKIDLRKSLFILPNLFTCSSIFCGVYATLICASGPSQDDFYRAALLIVFAMFFDGIDGRVARLTRTQSAFGTQLDSLADMVSFGVAPAVLVYRWSLAELPSLGAAVCILYVTAGAIRLARFNVLATTETGAPKRPGKYIVGLPIPGAAGVLVSLVVANHSVSGALPGSPMAILVVVTLLSFFMVSTVRFRSFKDLRLNLRTAALLLTTFAVCAAIAFTVHISFALVWLLASYLTIAVVESLLRLSRRRHHPTERTTERTTEPPTDTLLDPSSDKG